MDDEHIYKRHNKTLLLYHIIFPTKYRKKIITIKAMDKSFKNICVEISDRYEIKFLEIGIDVDHIHFLIQSVPTISITKIVTTIKSITAREFFNNIQKLRKHYGGNLWTSGFYANTVGQYGSRAMIEKYVKNQGREYTKFHQEQLTLL